MAAVSFCENGGAPLAAMIVDRIDARQGL